MGSGGTYGWRSSFDKEYYIRYANRTLTSFNTTHRKSNVTTYNPKLGFIRVSVHATDIHFYRETNQWYRGSILFNKYSSDVITTYTNEPVLTEDPGVTFLPTRIGFLPTPPASGSFILQARDGAISWIAS
jgi:hypothetical protein